jgi:multiple sugar transport system substrate-binding protein
LFDEAGAAYPPAEFGEMYVMPDGTEVEWNYDTLRDLAMFMTVDANGYDATMEEFDPENVVQFGLNFQWARIRLMWTDMYPADFYDEDANSVSIPEEWYTASEWLRDAVWVDHFIPTQTYADSELFGSGNNFQSGNVALSIVPTWYTCCMDASVGNFEFDFAVVPQSFDGEYHVATDADTFRILESTENPEAAFTALSYLLTEAVPTLAPVYGAFPAHPDYQQAWIDGLNDRYPVEGGLNTDVVVASLAYNNPGNQHHESYIPNWATAYDREFAFQSLIFGDTGADMDIAAELESLEADYNSIISN